MPHDAPHGAASSDAPTTSSATDNTDTTDTTTTPPSDRTTDATRKRLRLLGSLLRDLDLAVYMQLLALYHHDTSFFWLLLKSLIHASLLSPTPDTLERPDDPKPFLPLLLFAALLPAFLHTVYGSPAAGEDTRGYLHGGLVIDFIGQAPGSRVRLIALDASVLVLQLFMVSLHVARRGVKARLAGGGEAGDETGVRDVDAEERGVGAGTDVEDPLLAGEDEAYAYGDGYRDELEALSSGHVVLADVSLVDTLVQENARYNAFRRARNEAGAGVGGDVPAALRRLNTLRARLGGGVG